MPSSVKAQLGENNFSSKIAEKNKVNLEFEAAVCGGVPIIRSLKEGLIANKINRVYGIFNGTSNYILSTMDKENKNFSNFLIIIFSLIPISIMAGSAVIEINFLLIIVIKFL